MSTKLPLAGALDRAISPLGRHERPRTTNYIDNLRGYRWRIRLSRSSSASWSARIGRCSHYCRSHVRGAIKPASPVCEARAWCLGAAVPSFPGEPMGRGLSRKICLQIDEKCVRQVAQGGSQSFPTTLWAQHVARSGCHGCCDPHSRYPAGKVGCRLFSRS
ncbi:uncharacterized protein BDR25DRAFT_101757 [Lindgomyces ingoldianus]|uniref:Uncharacterized protein n=1 Tax=Lindgomyces ingoldianus TaxID=673940 RepID=A0ACB6RA33_9PLEO|nr:uncharacterized protein BDR25DRAFT_101757 [Lindgomyces ingoldianus]KAF2475326.1 hypothetical protein BDR25DRAFT_101757 [Lindgomyces ingoldianus]